MSTPDRRAHKRESLAPFTEIFPDDGGEPLQGYPTDMSRGGLALESDLSIAVDSRVNVAIHFDSVSDDENTATPVEFISAVVRRVVPLGEGHQISVEFIALSETEHPILSGVLQFIDE